MVSVLFHSYEIKNNLTLILSLNVNPFRGLLNHRLAAPTSYLRLPVFKSSFVLDSCLLYF